MGGGIVAFYQNLSVEPLKLQSSFQNKGPGAGAPGSRVPGQRGPRDYPVRL